jgi:hypothetical protein
MGARTTPLRGSVLVAFELCRSQPTTCATLLTTLDAGILTDLLSGERTTPRMGVCYVCFRRLEDVPLTPSLELSRPSAGQRSASQACAFDSTTRVLGVLSGPQEPRKRFLPDVDRRHRIDSAVRLRHLSDALVAGDVGHDYRDMNCCNLRTISLDTTRPRTFQYHP